MFSMFSREDLAGLLAQMSFGSSVRQRTWRKLSAQIRHGMSLNQSLQQMERRAKERRSPSALVFTRVLETYDRGYNLGVSLTGFASPEEVMLISGGQHSGRLSEGLDLAALLLASRRGIIRSVTSALAYPCLLMGLVLTLLVMVSTVVMPKLAILSDPKSWTGAAALFYAVTDFVASPLGVVALVSFLGLVLTILLTLPAWTGRGRHWVESLPPWSIYRLTVGTVWLFTLSTLMRSGMQLSHIMEAMINSKSVSPYLRERVVAIQEHIGHGKNLGDSMYDAGFGFPDTELIDDMRVYAGLPGFHDNIHELAKDWMTDGIEQIQRRSRIINLIAIILLTGIVVAIVVSMSSLQSQLLPTGA